MTTQVIIVGAGPVGLTLAIDLGQRGINCILVERNEASIQLPKMERCNARTMEIYRRLGIAEKIRKAGLPSDAPMDVFLATSMADPAIMKVGCPSVAESKAKIAAENDGQPLEPYQVISQYTLEPLLRSVAESLRPVKVRFGCELISLAQDSQWVFARVRMVNGSDETLRASYLVGCDGGASTVRRELGIELEGEGGIRKLRQALFYCNDLYNKVPMGKGRHYHIAEAPLFPFIILQDSTRHWTLHAAADNDAEMAEIFRRSVRMPISFDMISVNQWTQHLLCAQRYSDRRVFIAGDAAHLVIPTGGLGMNTGVGDAIDLSWKLWATLQGWGGSELLASYDAERRPIGLRNINASRSAMLGRLSWRAAYTPSIHDSSAEGISARAEMAKQFDGEQRKVTEILGIEAGYRYVDSPIICREPGSGPDPNSARYIPTTWPGARLPHVWLSDQTALHDRIGLGYTLLALGRTNVDTSALKHAFQVLKAPLEILEVNNTRAREIYGFELLLLRPDLHVVWRGNELPRDTSALASVAVGHSLPF